jgi:hypothetical protein
MNSKHRKTLKIIFTDPITGTLEWEKIESLLVSIGCKTIEGSGSRVRFVKDGIVGAFHRPHPQNTAKKYQIEGVREYLIKLGIQL